MLREACQRTDACPEVEAGWVLGVELSKPRARAEVETLVLLRSVTARSQHPQNWIRVHEPSEHLYAEQMIRCPCHNLLRIP